MRSPRTLLAASLATAGMLTLAACGTPASPGTHAQLGVDTSKVTTVDVWLAEYPFPGYLDTRKKLAEEFNAKHPGYRVKIKAFPYTQLPLEVSKAAAQGRAPAVANYYYSTTQLARDARNKAGKPLFTSVEKAIAGRSTILGEPVVTDDLLPALRAYYSESGDLRSMPLTAMTSLMYGNKKILDAAGVDSFPRTWRELERACKKVAKLADGPKNCVTWPNHSWFFQQAAAQQGGLLTDRAGGRDGRATQVELNSPEVLSYASWWEKLHRKGAYLYTGQPGDWGGNFEAFNQQNVAFVLDSANMGGMLAQEGEKAGYKVEAGPVPHNGRTPKTGNLTSGDSLWLKSGLDRRTRDGALAFMQFLNSTANGAEWHKNTQYLPMTESSAELLDEQGWFEQNPAPEVALEQIRATKDEPGALGPVLGGFTGVENELTKAMHDVLKDGARPAKRFGLADAEGQKILDDYNTRCVGAGPVAPDCLVVGELG
ncbi:ABC transporter substrate-binding protein [Streptomyces inusitatus]|uniref:ABC transporter substrate-binding protein n=1 Tax=Streptomyces inusitatus TaxID=68221 RepID=A0A918UZF1_9ACTN|nr:extracellular solute-binding protein [Streptomyces inusitatus]GGZ48875.1 ABC transporter substrate-binding protein [Streptomyces inusitatus]